MDLGSEWAASAVALAAQSDERLGSLESNETHHWWSPIIDAPCRTELVDHMSPFNLALGIILFVASSLSIVPSLTKPYNRKSSEGMSAMSLLLTNFQQTLQVVNLIMLKGEQIRMCSGNMIGCQPSLISFYSGFVAWALLFFQYLCTVWFPDPPDSETGARNRMLWNIQVGSCGFLVLASIIWICFSRCSENNFLRLTGIVAGLISSILMMFRFMPQLYATCRLRSSGSISYITYAVIGVGGFLQTYFNSVASGEEWSTWMPVFVGNCFQTVILLTCFYFDLVRPKVRESVARISASFAGENAEGAPASAPPGPLTHQAVRAHQDPEAAEGGDAKRHSLNSETEMSLTDSRVDPESEPGCDEGAKQRRA